MKRSLLIALLVLIPVLSLGQPTTQIPGTLTSTDTQRYVSTAAEWDATWADTPEATNTNITVNLTADLSRAQALPAFTLGTGAAAWDNKKLTINCNGHSLIAADLSTGATGSVFDASSNNLAKVALQGCSLINQETDIATTVSGIRLNSAASPIYLFRDLRLGNAVSDGLGHAFDFVLGGYKFSITDSEVLDFHPTNETTTPQPYDFTLSNNTIGYTSGNDYNDFNNFCVSVQNGDGRASIQSSDNQYVYCNGVIVAGGIFYSTGDFFDSMGYADGTDTKGWFQVGTRKETCTGIDAPYEACTGSGTGPNLAANASSGLAIDGAYIREDLNFSGYYQKLVVIDEALFVKLHGVVENPSASNDCSTTDLFGNSGVLLDTGNTTTSLVGPIDIKLSFGVDRNGADSGRVCFIGGTTALGDVILGQNMETLCDSGGRDCHGTIDVPGLGKWQLSGTDLYMQEGWFNVLGDNVKTAASFCDNGHDGVGGSGNAVFVDDVDRDCVKAYRASDGSAWASCQTSGTVLATGTYYNIYCDAGSRYAFGTGDDNYTTTIAMTPSGTADDTGTEACALVGRACVDVIDMGSDAAPLAAAATCSTDIADTAHALAFCK